MSEAVVPELLTQTIGAPSRDDRAYVTITQTENFGIEYFNGIERATRDVTVSGVHLVFDTTAGEGLLKSTVSQPDGRPCEDIRRFNVYADSVVVRSLIHLPGSHVLIQARELRFEDQGAIMTTPIDLGVPDDEPQLEDGLPIRGAPGLSGEPAGNITLKVGSVVVPTSELLTAPLTLSGRLTDASWRLSGSAGGVRFKIAPANSTGSGFAPDQDVRILLIPEKPASGLRTYIFGFRADEGNPGTAWITHTASQNPLGLAPRAAGKDTSAVPDPEGVNRSFAWPKSGALSGWIYFDSGYAAIGAGDRFLESKLAEWRDAALTRGAFRVSLA
jgi:hypothetical protein